MPHQRSVLRGLLISLQRALNPNGQSGAGDRPRGGPSERLGDGSSGNQPPQEPGGEFVTSPLADDIGDAPFAADLSANVERMEATWAQAADLVVRRFSIDGGPRVALVFLKGQVDDARLDLSVVRPLQRLRDFNGTSTPSRGQPGDAAQAGNSGQEGAAPQELAGQPGGNGQAFNAASGDGPARNAEQAGPAGRPGGGGNTRPSGQADDTSPAGPESGWDGRGVFSRFRKPIKVGRRAGPSTRLQRLLEKLEETAVHTVHVEVVTSFADGVERVAQGNALLLVDGETAAIAINVQDRPHRSVEEPGTETVVRGPREGFIEDLDTNLALVRTRVRHPGLRFLSYRFGRYSQTRVRVLYLEGRAPRPLIDEVKRRMERITVDAVVESSYIEELIEDAPYSPFPQIMHTERPDVAAAALYEGRVVILTDGSPFALIAPITFWSLLQASEDYYQRHILSSFVRLLRVALVIGSVTLPALYIAAVIFHHGMLPTPLLITIAASRERVPLPAALEIFLFEVAFEAFREAGVRLPRSVGQTVGIVGGIIIGQAAVQAGLISAPVIVVIALTGLASFATPHVGLAGAMRILRFFLILMAAAFGLYGILIGGGLIQVHLLALRSFGVPYLWPVAPLDLKALKDTVVRWPHWSVHDAPHPQPETGPAQTSDSATERRQSGSAPPRPAPPPGPREKLSTRERNTQQAGARQERKE